MSSYAIAALVLTCVFAGAVVGLLVRAIVPESHLSGETKDTVKLSAGLVGSMVALVLGLLVASAKSAYDAQKAELTELSANAALLDRVLAHYGPAAAPARQALHEAVASVLARLWSADPQRRAAAPTTAAGEAVYEQLHRLAPADDYQRTLLSESRVLISSMGRTRLLLFEQSGTSISRPLLFFLTGWLAMIFLGFGLLAPRNATAITALLLGALAVSGSIFLILELDQPFSGLIRISDAPLRQALAALGRP
jgi:hypothetical protein